MIKKLKIRIVGAYYKVFKCALFPKNFDVVLFDRDELGSHVASYGNALFFNYASLSLNRTDILADVPAMLMSSTGPLALEMELSSKNDPWFVKFI